MTLSEHQRIFTKDIGLLIAYAYSLGLELTFGEAWRSQEEQARLYAAGLSKIKNGGNHGKRLAVDFNLFKNGKLTWDWEDYEPLGRQWVRLNTENRWGGSFNGKFNKTGFLDAPHFERNIVK